MYTYSDIKAALDYFGLRSINELKALIQNEPWKIIGVFGMAGLVGLSMYLSRDVRQPRDCTLLPYGCPASGQADLEFGPMGTSSVSSSSALPAGRPGFVSAIDAVFLSQPPKSDPTAGMIGPAPNTGQYTRIDDYLFELPQQPKYDPSSGSST